MAKRVWTVDEIISKALLDDILSGSADGESADDLTKLAVVDQSGAGSYALEFKVTETLTADRALTIKVNNAARTIDISGNVTLAGALTTSGAYGITLTATNTTAITLPTTGTLATTGGSETLTNKTLTAPDINGGTADSLTSLSIRSTGASYDLLFATAVAFGANRTLTVTIPDANTALTLTGDLIRSGAHSLTLTTTGTTDVTLPTTGTLITNAVATLASLTTVGTIGTGTWNADVIDVTYGGTGLATITDHSVMLGSGTGAITPLGVGASGKLLRGATGADPTWSTLTMPDTIGANELFYASSANVLAAIAAGTSSILVTDGSDVPSFATDIPTAVTIGGAYITRVGGTDVTLADGGTNNSLTADNGAIVYSDATKLALLAAGSAGQLVRSGGAGAPTWTTFTIPATIGANEMLYASGANVFAAISAGTSSVLVTDGSDVPSFGTDIPTAVTIGAAYIYRAGGTDVAVADGGTNMGSYTTGDILHATAAGTLAGLADVAVGQVLCSGGVGVIAAWSATPTFTSSVQSGRGEVGIINLKDDTELTISTGAVTATQSFHTIDTEADGATDNLDTISGGSEGDILIFRPNNAGRTVVAKHGSGNLNLSGGADFTMDEDDDWLMLLYDGTNWQEISRSENHA